MIKLGYMKLDRIVHMSGILGTTCSGMIGRGKGGGSVTFCIKEICLFQIGTK